MSLHMHPDYVHNPSSGEYVYRYSTDPYDLDFLRSHGYPTLPTVSSATYVSRHWNSAAPLSDLAGPAVEHPIPYAGADAARVNPRKRSRREEADPSSRHLPVPKRRQEGGNSQLHYTGSATSRRPIEVISLIDSDDDELKPLNNRRDHHSMPAAPPTHVPLPENNASTDVVPISEPVLCKEQRDLVDLITSGQNVFYTGSAGCGKSTVLKAFVKIFTASGKKVNIIAPTGRAALDINGSTTWTYMGWTPDSHKKPLKKLREGAHGKFVRQRLRETDVLIVDEISMIENLHFERMNAVMKEARDSESAFGGVQVVVTGDFCQLPPVKPFCHCITCGSELISNTAGTEYRCRLRCPPDGKYYDIDKWAFRSQAWKECNFKHVNLTNIHRQSDGVFINILQKLRMGRNLLPKDTDLLLNHESETRNAIKLFATRDEVKRVNDEAFSKLRSTARSYKCLDHFYWNQENHPNLESKAFKAPDGTLNALKDHRFDSQLQLKQGMLVVLLVNLDIKAGLVNGSQGTIQGFEAYDPKKMPKATTSSRGPRQEQLEMEANMNGVPTLAGEHAQFREDQIKQYIKHVGTRQWPVVQFLNGPKRTIYADCTVNELGDKAPHSLLSRTQIPLMAAWAITTHKSQGMTLNRVIVDLSKSFEQGQAYVALSRARSLEGLKVLSFPASAQGKGNEQVKEFLREKFDIV